MKLPRSICVAAQFAAVLAFAPVALRAAAADDDLFSSKPTKPSPAPASVPTGGAPAPAPTAPGAKVAAVLPAPASSPLTAEEVDALRVQYAGVVERSKKILEAGQNDPDRDRVLRRLAEVAIDAGEYDLAASTVEFFTAPITAIDDVLKPIMVRLHAAQNPQGVRVALQRANQLAEKTGWPSLMISRVVDNTQFAHALGDPAVFKDQVQLVVTVSNQAADRKPADVWVGLDIALKLPALRRLMPEIADPFHAGLRQRVGALPDSDALKPTRRAEVAQLLLRTGQFADALTEVAFAGEAAVAIYTDAAAIAQATAGEEFAAKLKAMGETYAARDAYDRFVVFALAAHALSGAGRHEDALRAALHAETHRAAYGARPNATYSKSELHRAWDGMNAASLAPAEYESVLSPIVGQAVRENAHPAALSAALQDPAGKPHATALLNHALHVLLGSGRLDDALAVIFLHDAGENGYAPLIATALIRAGRLEDVETRLLRGVSDQRRRDLASTWVKLADAWLDRGNPEKARAVLDAASQGTLSDWQATELAVGWSRLGDTARFQAARSRVQPTPENQQWFSLLELQTLADAGNFPALAQRIAALPEFAKDSRFWSERVDVLGRTLARAGQWPLLAALAEKANGIERARPLIAELGEVLRLLKQAVNQTKAPAVAADAKVLLAPYAKWVAERPEAEQATEEGNLFYVHGRLGAWEEAFAAAGAAGFTPARRTQAFLSLSHAARDNRDWARATACLAEARAALAQVTGADRTPPLLIAYCNEALFTREMNSLGERFREAAGLINQSTKQEDRTNQFSDLALVAARAADNGAFQQLAGAALQSAAAWAKEEPGENGAPPRAEYSMSWFVRQLAQLGHVDVAEKITQGSIKSEEEKASLHRAFRVRRLLATPDEKLVDALKQGGDQGERLKALIDTYGDNLAVRLAEQGRSEIAFKLMLMARDGDFATAHDSQGFGAAAWTNTSVKSLLEYNWPSTVENMARAYLEAGRTATAVRLGELYTTPRQPFASGAGISEADDDAWLSAANELVRPRIDYTGDQARFAMFLAEKGQLDEARRLLQAIPASAFTASADNLRESVVLALAQLGELGRAENLASGIKDPTPRMNAHTGLVLAALRRGDGALAQKHLAVARTAAADQRTNTNWKRPVYLAALVLAGDADAALQEIGTLQGYTQSNAAREPALQLARLGRWSEIAPWISRMPAAARAGSWMAVFNELAPRPHDPSIKP